MQDDHNDQIPNTTPSQSMPLPPVDSRLSMAAQQPAQSPSPAPPVIETTQAQTPPIAPQNIPESISWQASEYIEQSKSKIWFFGLVVIAVILIAVAIFILRAWTFAVLIVVMTAAIWIFARRPARVISYNLTTAGIDIDGKYFPIHNFRAFGIEKEGSFYSINLIPLKRFSPAVNLYFPPDDGEAIVDLLGSMLPMEEQKTSAFDGFVNRLRF